MALVFKRSAGWKWVPDSDDTNAEEGVLLRSDNTTADKIGSRSLRLGSAAVYSDLGGSVNNAYSPVLESTSISLLGVGDDLYVDGMSEAIGFDGSGDIAFGDDSYQAFAARGKTKKKWSDGRLLNWGISRPSLAPELSAIDAILLTICGFDSTDSLTINEGASLTPVYVADHAGVASKALSIQPDASTGRAATTKKWNADQDFLNFRGNTGGQTDLFDLRVWMEEPRKVDKVTLMFGMGTGADPFLDDYFYFDFNIRNNGTVDIKDAASNAAAAYAAANNRLISPLTPQDATGVRSPEEAGRILRSLGRFAGSRSRERTDSQAASPAWGHLSVTRGQFNRVGGTPGRSWATVRGFKVVYTALPGSTEHIYLDDAVWSGGGAKALTGTFLVGYRFARKFTDDSGSEVYTELSPMSPISKSIVLQQQTLEVTIPAAAMNERDEQVNQIWVYMYGGFLDTYYRVSILSSASRSGMTIDDVHRPDNLDAPYEWSLLTSHGFSETTTQSPGTEDLVASLYKSELDALTENEPFEPGATGPPDNIIGIAGPLHKRLYVLTSEGWLYPSTQKSPSSYSLYATMDLRMYGTPYWIANTASGIYVGCSKDIIAIQGSGDQIDTISADIEAIPLRVANPPCDSSFCVDGNSIIYRAADGPMTLSGVQLQSIQFAGTATLWRGEQRHGLQPLNIESGRFRMASDNHMLYMIATEGGGTTPTSIWRFNGEWERYVYPFTPMCIHRNNKGKVLVGSSGGGLYEIETGDTDDGADVDVHILTPLTEGNSPTARKDPADFQIHAMTGGVAGRLEITLDRSAEVAKTINFATIASGIYRDSILDIGPFLRMQVRILGAFSKFFLHGLGYTCNMRPNHAVAIDLGSLTQSGDLSWVNQIELDMHAANDVDVEFYRNDVLHSTQTISVSKNKRDVYTVVPPRDTKARRVGVVLRSTVIGEGFTGFELYSVKVRSAETGNVTELSVSQGDGRSDA